MDMSMDAISQDALGYVAALLILASFSTADIMRLRLIAILSNIAVIFWAHTVGATPFLLLHSLLLPVNAYRLIELLRSVKTKSRAVSRAKNAVPVASSA